MDTNYKLDTTEYEEVYVRFYSDEGIDVIIDKGIDKGNIQLKNVKKETYKIKDKLDDKISPIITIRGNKKGKYGIVVTVVKKKDKIIGKKFNVSELKEAIKEIKPSLIKNN